MISLDLTDAPIRMTSGLSANTKGSRVRILWVCRGTAQLAEEKISKRRGANALRLRFLKFQQDIISLL